MRGGPDVKQWRDVIVGAVVTAVLFTIGKSLISWYIGSSAVAFRLRSRRRADRAATMGLLFCDGRISPEFRRLSFVSHSA